MRNKLSLLIITLLLAVPLIASAQLTALDPFAGTARGGLVNSIVSVINALLVLAAIAAMAYIIWGGVQYISSQGDEDSANRAKLTIIYGIIGIIVILLSAVIVNFFLAAI